MGNSNYSLNVYRQMVQYYLLRVSYFWYYEKWVKDIPDWDGLFLEDFITKLYRIDSNL